MCRVAVRQAPRNREAPTFPAEPPEQPLQFSEQLARLGSEYCLDLDLGSDNLGELGADAADLDFMGAVFGLPEEPVLGQPLLELPPVKPEEHGQTETAPVYFPSTQEMQMQALLAQQASLPAPVFMAQYQALLQQQAVAQHAAMSAQAGFADCSLTNPSISRRGKSQQEIAAQQERVKKRRRESAQRSRNRKNAYMQTLEVENKALKVENQRLRMELMRAKGEKGSTHSSSYSKPGTPAESSHGMPNSSDGIHSEDLPGVNSHSAVLASHDWSASPSVEDLLGLAM